MTHAHRCWTELLTSDLDSAAAFYEKVIGWQRRPFFDHAAFYRGERVAAGLDRTPPGVPPVWFSQVHVADLDEARRRTVALGGRILREEIPIPGVGRMSVILDNVGAVLALFQPAPEGPP